MVGAGKDEAGNRRCKIPGYRSPLTIGFLQRPRHFAGIHNELLVFLVVGDHALAMRDP